MSGLRKRLIQCELTLGRHVEDVVLQWLRLACSYTCVYLVISDPEELILERCGSQRVKSRETTLYFSFRFCLVINIHRTSLPKIHETLDQDGKYHDAMLIT